MHKMTTGLRTENDNIRQFHGQGIWAAHEKFAGHILCKHCIMQEHHDQTWKYRKTGSRNHIDNDGEHRGPPAENIDYKMGSPTLDTISLGKAKSTQQHT
eukprot:14473748-Heterocapsa_arctica.AAC.1